MIASIKKFIENNIQHNNDVHDNTFEHALQLATAALLIEISRADLDVKEEERRTIIGSIRSNFSLTEDETRELISLAEDESQNASSYHEFTSLINEAFSLEKKIKIVGHLWEVAFADSELEKHEEHLIRKIAGLLYVPHKDFIATKLRVKEKKLSKKKSKGNH
jgi:uncharacterized tellurite resistance protein B-like protein